MAHVTDPREDIIREIGDLSEFKLFNNQILIGLYVRPAEVKTAGGILLPDQTRKEDEYQGKTGVVLAKGPLAFVDDTVNKFRGQNVDVGDWVCFRVSDGWSLAINGVPCRLLEEVHVKAKIPSPDYVY